MPWTASDATKHKKGLTPKQAQTWAKVANSALASCEKQGKADCDGYAIRVANAAVTKAAGPDGDGAELLLTVEATITKADDSQQRLFGWASIAVRKTGEPLVDLQGDVIAIEDLEEAWYDYVVESGELNFQHAGPVRGHLIESMVFTPEKLVAMGLPADSVPLGAWVGYHVPDPEDYATVKQLGYFMFSIEGSALRESL